MRHLTSSSRVRCLLLREKSPRRFQEYLVTGQDIAHSLRYVLWRSLSTPSTSTFRPRQTGIRMEVLPHGTAWISTSFMLYTKLQKLAYGLSGFAIMTVHA